MFQLIHYMNKESGLIFQDFSTEKLRYKVNFLYLEEGRFRTKDLKLPLLSGAKIRASCNGLILLENIPESGDLSVANPVTKQWIKLPPPAPNKLLSSRRIYASQYGFTWHPGTNEYKVLCFSERKAVCLILTLGSDKWELVNVPEQFIQLARDNTSVNGFLHSIDGDFDDGDKEDMLSMDTADKSFHKKKLPKCRGEQDKLLELGGSLSFISRIDSTAEFEIWVLKDFDKGDWIKLYSVKLDVGVKLANSRSLDSAKPICCLMNGKLVVFAVDRSFYAASTQQPWVKRIWNLKTEHCLTHLNTLVSCKTF
ncbi:PREDICTED: F-box protein At3g07870-like isoform X2 [Nelumbo nucifera]|uniref:F-box protein At3g07870-like isoform X2 n=1 Tax=Nelumbo nucifera TaxID=4432 RepID=A0A1U8BKT0_NELNU|nr:PREDICTED: F-box protein At3g07870-like isoform X2 [Nelumbo nucifera]